MFEKQFFGCLPRLYLWQLCFGMPNDMIGKVCITIRKKVGSCLLPSDGEETASVGASTFDADAMTEV